MTLYSSIMFESMGVVNLTIPGVWWKKSSGSTPFDNARQAKLLGMVAPTRPNNYMSLTLARPNNF